MMKLILKRIYVFLAYFFSITILLYIPFANEALTEIQLFKEFWFIYLVIAVVLASAMKINISK